MISYLRKFLAKFVYAFSGLKHGIFHDHSISLQCIIGILVLILCSTLSLSSLEWISIMALILLVLMVEFMNSALEHLVDFVCPQIHEKAKIIKDYGAAAVLLSSVLAALVGLYIIGGKLF